MGTTPNPNTSLKLDTIKKYITLMGNLAGNVSLSQPRTETGTLAASGNTLSEIVLSAASSTVDDHYTGLTMRIQQSSTVIEERKIIKYVGATKHVTLTDNLTVIPNNKPYAIKIFDLIHPMVRLENSNKTMFRKMYDEAQKKQDIKTNADVYSFPLLTYKLTGMTIDTSRLTTNNLKLEGETKDDHGLLKNLTSYIGNPVPYDFNFDITVWSNLYSHLLDYIENFVFYFYLANTFTVTILENSDNTLRLLHDTVIYLNSISTPAPLDIIDTTTNEPIQSTNISLVLKGFIIPPVHNAKIIKTITTNFYVQTETDLPYLNIGTITKP